MNFKTGSTIAILIGAMLIAIFGLAVAQGQMHGTGRMHQMMHGGDPLLFGIPGDPSESWTLARGGRLYDNLWRATGREGPDRTHPTYPKSAKKSGADTWRCKECHGWDYKGRYGQYGSGSHRTGFRGIELYKGRDPAHLARLLRSPLHGYSREMIGDADLAQVAAFVVRGQHDADAWIDRSSGEVLPGERTPEALVARGAGIFQTTCAACHGFDGRYPAGPDGIIVGDEARSNPWEVLHKIRNGHPGQAMINLRAFPEQDAAAVLAYARTLPGG